MRWLPVTFLVAACAGYAQTRDIVDVLRQSQQARLDSMPAAAPGPRVETVREPSRGVRSSPSAG